MTTPKLIMLTEPRSSAAEAYRTLRTNLMFMNSERPISSILLTSPAASEEKSLALANLAVAFAQSGSSTIIVDSDLRKPIQHQIWGLANERGLTTMMTENTALSNPPLQPTPVENLSLLASGPPHPIPADILSSVRLPEVIGLLKARAHYLLFDGPPVLAATDAALLGLRVDGVLLVVRAGSTRRDHVQRARQALERVNVRLLGVVLTNAPRERMEHYG